MLRSAGCDAEICEASPLRGVLTDRSAAHQSSSVSEPQAWESACCLHPGASYLLSLSLARVKQGDPSAFSSLYLS